VHLTGLSYLEDTLLFVEEVYSQYGGSYGHRLASTVSHFPSLARHYSVYTYSVTDSTLAIEYQQIQDPTYWPFQRSFA
jgi:hypothetical protein